MRHLIHYPWQSEIPFTSFLVTDLIAATPQPPFPLLLKFGAEDSMLVVECPIAVGLCYGQKSRRYPYQSSFLSSSKMSYLSFHTASMMRLPLRLTLTPIFLHRCLRVSIAVIKHHN